MSFIESIFLFVVFPIWLFMMASFAYFYLHVSPMAIRRWARENGYKIVRVKNAGPFEWMSLASGNGHRVYRVVVEEKAGHVRKGLLRVGNANWMSVLVARCPVESRWDDPDKSSPDAARRRDKTALWERELA
jgi:hypothetical protein